MKKLKQASSYLKEWRRQHRRGLPSILEADAEVNAFVEADITKMTFKALADAIQERFGPDRSTSKQALHRYWTKHKARILSEQDNGD